MVSISVIVFCLPPHNVSRQTGRRRSGCAQPADGRYALLGGNGTPLTVARVAADGHLQPLSGLRILGAARTGRLSTGQ
jgi:hypothetical protein